MKNAFSAMALIISICVLVALIVLANSGLNSSTLEKTVQHHTKQLDTFINDLGAYYAKSGTLAAEFSQMSKIKLKTQSPDCSIFMVNNSDCMRICMLRLKNTTSSAIAVNASLSNQDFICKKFLASSGVKKLLSGTYTCSSRFDISLGKRVLLANSSAIDDFAKSMGAQISCSAQDAVEQNTEKPSVCQHFDPQKSPIVALSFVSTKRY